MIIAVTGFGTDAEKRRARAAGIDLHLLKPVEPETLLKILRKFQKLLSGDR